MSKDWNIFRKLTDTDREPVATVHTLEYHGEWMGDEYVLVSVKSSEPIDFHFGDFLTYRGEDFTINYDPNVVKKARRGTYGEGFTYDNIKLYTDASGLKNVGFKDVVLNDNLLTYSSLSKFPFFCASIEDLADRLQANLDRNGDNQWQVLTPNWNRTYQRIGESIARTEWSAYYPSVSADDAILGETDVDIQIDNQSCWDIMSLAYSKFGLQWYVRNRIIVIGGDAVKADHIFRYGKGLGLYEIERTSDESQEIITRLFAYGSEQNLPLNYYANSLKHSMAGVTSNGENAAVTDVPWDRSMFTSNRSSVGTYTVRVRTNGSDYPATAIAYEPEGGTAVIRVVTDNVAPWVRDTLTEIEFVGGVDKNKWPSSHTVTDGTYPGALSINKLMLPGFPKQSLRQWVSGNLPELLEKYDFSDDAFDPWIQSKNADVIGKWEGTINYDGSSQQEIKPTIEGTGLDVVQWAEQIDDNGYLKEGDDDTFDMLVLDGGIGWDYSGETINISMKDGYCVGHEFEVQKAKIQESGNWLLTLKRHNDSSGRYFPYSADGMQAGLFQVMGTSNHHGYMTGDHMIVTGIPLPDSYVEAAAVKMLIAACGYLDKRDHMRYTYLPKIDEIFMARQHESADAGTSYHDILRSGMQLEFEDTDLGIWRSPFIDSITINEKGNDGEPTYEVVLRDEKEKGTLEKLTEKISDLTGATQVVERQGYPSMNVDYPEWVEGTPYYYQTLNTEPNPDISDKPYVETSYVWHHGKKWMCLRTLTPQEPKLGCTDWKVVEGDQTFTMRFYRTDGSPYGDTITTRRTNINFTLIPRVMWGTEDVTDKVDAWQWKRYLTDGTEDTGWGVTRKERQTTITTADMPTGWDAMHPAKFECVATLTGIDTEISTDINI